MRRLFLTFDVEDFLSSNSVPVLKRILESLKKHELNALLFITGYMAEKFQDFPSLTALLNEHIIGYHSTSHSVHPTIPELTDIPSYESAYRVSMQRESSHINPLTGEIEGEGGIIALKRLFPKKQIVAFRAPGHCWSPPHLEALRHLGIKYDFSANLSTAPVDHRGITFYPYPVIGHFEGKLRDCRLLSISFARRHISVVTIHPSLLGNRSEWDSIYSKSNPTALTAPLARSPQETASLLKKLDMLFKSFSVSQRIGIVKIAGNLGECKKNPTAIDIDIEKCYTTSIRWAERRGYKPKFLHQHFLKFFQTELTSKQLSMRDQNNDVSDK